MACPRGLSRHETIATAVAGNSQDEWLQVFLDAQTQRQVFDARLRLDLPPFTIFAQSPFAVGHWNAPFEDADEAYLSVELSSWTKSNIRAKRGAKTKIRTAQIFWDFVVQTDR
jgi:hypothetical protein